MHFKDVLVLEPGRTLPPAVQVLFGVGFVGERLELEVWRRPRDQKSADSSLLPQ